MKFSYVQIGAKNLDKLVEFYKKALDFKESDKTYWLGDKKGVVLEAPGFKEDSIVFGFYQADTGEARAINDRGFAHICFETIDVNAAIKRFVKYGGTFLSTLDKPEKKPCVYCKDIEGNVVEFHIPFPANNKGYLNTIACLLQLRRDKGIRKETGSSLLRFIHVNIITEDWRGLCDYYNNTFESIDFGKIKDHSGKFKESVIGVPGVHVLGKHILLPGFYDTYPTLEIFEYSIKGKDTVSTDNEQGINLIGFTSSDLESDSKKIVDNGGELIEKVSDSRYIMSDIQKGLIILNK